MATSTKAAHELQVRTRTDDVLNNDGVEFSSLLLSKPVLEGLSASGFQRPSPIQLKAIPLGRCGLDLIVQAKSGTGKTCVFTTIALDSLILENTVTQVLVLAPTREIAVQIHAVVMAIGSSMEGLECHVFIGGRPVSQDKLHLKKCHIAIGSPGRIKQLIEMGALITSSIRLFVLDEADKLLEDDSSSSFQEQINWIFSSLPTNKQMLALSATYPESLAQYLSRYMREPTFVRLNPTDPGLIGLKQYYKIVPSHSLPHKIFEEKVQSLLELFSKIPFNQALVFSNLHSRAQHLADILSSKGLPAVCISGGLSQDQRLEAMWKLKQYQCRVLISTDLTSRGIDAEKVNLVINLDVPQDWETYMHRIGRAGRFGTLGVAVTYCCHGEEENRMMAIAQKCSLNLTHLPDPIPPGIMEEACDWGVIIEPPSKPTRKVPVSPKQEKKKQVKSEATSFKPSRVSHIPNPTEERRTSDKPYNVAETKAKNHSKPRMEKPLPSATNLETRSTLTQTEQRDTLPKIPPLPSFKSRARKIMTFAEAEAAYESFITEGPGRSVEIIRQYEGCNRSQSMFNGLHNNHDDHNDEDGANDSHVPDASHSHQDPPLPPDVSELSSGSKFSEDSLSSDYDSSSESKMEVESESNSSVPNRSSQHRHHTHVLPDNDVSQIRRSVDCNKNQRDQSSLPAARIQTHSSRSKQTYSKLQSHNPPHHKGPTASKSRRKATTTQQRFTKEKTDDVEEEVAGQDYWDEYRAWVEYYNSYYHRSPYYWMRAFSSYSIYMMEMMKR
ncbi:probable ATP-dependent RNA helicase DDX20 [Triplophysa rosa]|uniref:Probable ATP-dependent RNA helicase DDX20 n=1 Tax=Triplophysa rosa TaxID=992332 RepID=A0A9W7TI21_TRIRA|nr:probable ATP-dependent RNA helicase DDX20 [Triplophysa rosa]KAI7797630.1 Probable ATP-dependent RNA helicase DDX20 [Triplophysa rosa]